MSELNNKCYDDKTARPEFYKVEGFDPQQYLSTMKHDDGTEWLGLTAEIKKFWFRLVYPNGKIMTDMLEHDATHVIINARIYANKTDKPEEFLSEGKAIRFYSDADPNKAYERYYIDFAETIALGRALTNAGFDLPLYSLLPDGSADKPEQPSAPAYSALTSPPEQNPDAKPVIPPSGASTVQQMPKQQEDSKSKEQVSPAPKPQNYEEALKMLTVEQAKSMVVSFGSNTGKKLGEIALTDAGSLDWIANKYKGGDFTIKAAARILLNAALKNAS